MTSLNAAYVGISGRAVQEVESEIITRNVDGCRLYWSQDCDTTFLQHGNIL